MGRQAKYTVYRDLENSRSYEVDITHYYFFITTIPNVVAIKDRYRSI